MVERGRGSQLCSRRSPLQLGRLQGHTRGRANPGGEGRGSGHGRGGGGFPVVLSGGRHCGWERPFHALLGPHGWASSEGTGGARTTGKGTGTAWSREPRIPFSELPNLAVAETPRVCGQGLYQGVPGKLRAAQFSQEA